MYKRVIGCLEVVARPTFSGKAALMVRSEASHSTRELETVACEGSRYYYVPSGTANQWRRLASFCNYVAEMLEE
jgi:hypothetical protein